MADSDRFTQFEPLSPPANDRPTNTFTDFFMKFFERGADNDFQASSNSQQTRPPGSSGSNLLAVPESIEDTPRSVPTSAPSSPYVGRSFSTVTSRISSLLTRNSVGSSNNDVSSKSIPSATESSEKRHRQLKDYNSSDFRQYWMPDSRGKECYECQEKFTTFRRRHHCRICGQIFCSRCCKQEIPGRLLGYMGDLRLCNYCCRVVLQYLSSPAGERAWQRAESGGSQPDVIHLRENLLRSLADSTPISIDIQIPQVDEVNVEDEETDDDDLFDPVAPRKLSAASEAWSTPVSGHSTNRQRQPSLSSINDFQPNFGIESTIQNAVPAAPTSSLRHSSSLNNLNPEEQRNSVDTETAEPDWLRLIELDEDVRNKLQEVSEQVQAAPVEDPLAVDCVDTVPTADISRSLKRNNIRRKTIGADLFQRDDLPSRKSAKRSFAGAPPVRHFASTSPVLSKFRSTPLDKAGTYQQRPAQLNVHYGPLHKVFEAEAQKVLEFLLRRLNVNVERWKPVLWPLTQEIAFSVQPQVRSRKDDMDALRYIHVKTLQSSLIPAAQVIFGTVCTKAVADKRMRQSLTYPSVFVVGGSIEYERVGGKFCPIDPILMQEKQYLQSLVRKVAALKPQVLVVEKSVARLAQDYFRQAGVTLVFNMKQSALSRVARSVEASVAPSVEDQLIKPRMGRCGSFRTETYTILNKANPKSTDIYGAKSKTLMFFEDCPPDLGCAIILTGPDIGELRLVKKVAKFMICAAYSSKLEIEFLRAYQACIETATMLEKPLSTEDSTDLCPICVKNSELTVESNLHSLDDEGQSQDEDLRRDFLQRVQEASFTASSFIGVHLPYLQTKHGSLCPLRLFFNMDHLRRGYNDVRDCDSGEDSTDSVPVRPTDSRSIEVASHDQPSLFGHSFVNERLINPVESFDVKRKLARYRAQSAKLFRKNVASLKRREISMSSLDNGKDGVGNDSLNGTAKSQLVDVLNPFLHRRIAVLYCSYSPKSENAPGFCLKPRVFIMHFYGRFDVTLGDYLERFCFNPAYECANENCDATMVSHVRKLVHGNCCIEITTQSIDIPNPSPDSTKKTSDMAEEHVLCWNWCGLCKTTTPSTPMNSEFWHLSFARYLEYLFNGKHMGSFTVRDVQCTHCLFHQHQHYFAFRNSVVSFKCSPITLYDISFPPSICKSIPERLVGLSLVEEAMALSEKAGQIFNHMVEILCGVRSFVQVDPSGLVAASSTVASVSSAVNDLHQFHENEQEAFRAHLEVGQSLLRSFHSGDELRTNDDQYRTIIDSNARCRHILARCVQQWNSMVSDVTATLKKKQLGEESKTSLSKLVQGLAEEGALEKAASIPAGLVDQSSNEESVSIIKRPSTNENDKRQLVKLLSNANLAAPFDVNEHYTIPPNAKGTPIVMRENEISSIVAFALCSDEYENQRKSMREAWNSEGFILNLRGSQFGTGHDDATGDPSADRDELSSGSLQQHIELEFIDGSARFYCKIYYAEKFRLLRKLIFPEGEDAFARSLARCKPWQPKGGKSGATFYLSGDKRFILKQLSRFEIQSLLKFAGNYFQYTASSCTENKLSALAKIFGVYRIGLRNPQTNVAVKLDLLVMEYLFYNRNIAQVYDLKGSLRNRFASEKRQADLVLLDENLLKTICSNSFYLYTHSKTALNVAINNDSEFLASNSIMDYSLLVGVDEERRELVLGIIDFMRTFTWDKKVESWVKSVSVTGQLPTVISPDLYRDRFVEIMDIYFPVAPDQWTGLS